MPYVAPASDLSVCESISVSERLIDALLEALQRFDRGVVVERQVLHEQHAGDAPRRIDPELRVVDAGPAHAAGRACGAVVVPAGDLKAEPERVAARAERERPGPRGVRRGLLLDANVADVVLAHELHGRLAEQSRAVRGAPSVQEHLHELDVVGRRRVQAAVAADRRADRPIRVRRLDEFLAHHLMDGGDAPTFRIGHRIKSIAHAQRHEDALAQEFLERLPGHLFDKSPEHACAFTVSPFLAGIVQQRVARRACTRNAARETEQYFVREPVAQPGRVREQMAHGDVTGRRPARVGFVCGVERLEHLRGLERRQIHRDRIVQADVAFLNQHHHSHGSDRLRHRSDAKDRVPRHRYVCADVLLAECAAVQNPVAVGDHRYEPGNVRLLDGALEIGIDLGAVGKTLLRYSSGWRERSQHEQKRETEHVQLLLDRGWQSGREQRAQLAERDAFLEAPPFSREPGLRIGGLQTVRLRKGGQCVAQACDLGVVGDPAAGGASVLMLAEHVL